MANDIELQHLLSNTKVKGSSLNPDADAEEERYITDLKNFIQSIAQKAQIATKASLPWNKGLIDRNDPETNKLLILIETLQFTQYQTLKFPVSVNMKITLDGIVND